MRPAAMSIRDSPWKRVKWQSSSPHGTLIEWTPLLWHELSVDNSNLYARTPKKKEFLSQQQNFNYTLKEY